jgi:photosystem II stability/assembly factor-like uncharacterized protein
MALSPDFARDETVYLGTETGLFRSTSGGRAWRELGLPTDLAPVLDVVVSPAYAVDGTIFVGTESAGLLRSTDKGRSWTRVGENVLTDTIARVVADPPYLLAMQDSGLLISPDEGRSWVERAGVESGLEMPIALATPCGLTNGQFVRVLRKVTG